jgi:hypothetical protein
MYEKPQFEIPETVRELAERNVEIQSRAMRYAEQNIDASFAFASDLARARDLREYLEVQQRWAQQQMQNYAQQAQDLGRMMAEAAQKSQPKT